MSEQRKYKFSWDNTVGSDMGLARPSLGPKTSVEAYRMFQFTLRDLLEQNYGADVTDDLFRQAGVMAGREFFKRFCNEAADLASLSNILRNTFINLGIGILRVEKADAQKMEFTFNVDEDLDCSGMPDTSEVICVYDEGFIKGILEEFSGKKFTVREVDCWCSGSRPCRFDAHLAE